MAHTTPTTRYYLEIGIFTRDGEKVQAAEACYLDLHTLMEAAGRFAGAPIREVIAEDDVSRMDLGDEDLDQPVTGFTAEASADESTVWSIDFSVENFGVEVRTPEMPKHTRVPMPNEPVILRSMLGDYEDLSARPTGLSTSLYFGQHVGVYAYRGNDRLGYAYVDADGPDEIVAVLNTDEATAAATPDEKAYLEAFAFAVTDKITEIQGEVISMEALAAINEHVSALGGDWAKQDSAGALPSAIGAEGKQQEITTAAAGHPSRPPHHQARSNIENTAVSTAVSLPGSPVHLETPAGTYEDLPPRPEGVEISLEISDGSLRGAAWRGDVYLGHGIAWDDEVLLCVRDAASEAEADYLREFLRVAEAEVYGLVVDVLGGAMGAVVSHVMRLGEVSAGE